MTQTVMGMGRRIAAYRKSEGMTAQDLAEDAGMSRSVIANIENGRRDDITVSELLAISRALRVPPVAILFDVNRPMAPVPAPGNEGDISFRPRAIDIVDWVAGLDGPSQWSHERLVMEEELARNGPATTSMGMVLEASYGDSGWSAIRLLMAGRQLRTATEDHAELVRDFALDVKTGEFGWEPALDEHLSIMREVQDLTRRESVTALEDFLTRVSEHNPGQLQRAQDAVHELRSSAQDLKTARGLLVSLGGDPSAHAHPTDEVGLPAFGYEEVLTMWTRMRSEYLKDQIEGGIDRSKYRTYDQIRRAIKSGKLKRKDG
ncbi:hypothetical protein GCM10009825_01190 [Arthrobacter humicola]|uniref:HTH cro/C1-type domain-containing protein n=1 Tax=Arthrobacter humicola TaxID=409291 RepID=A0ABN2YC97_9MICC